MDRAYTLQQMKRWQNMSEAGQHAWMLREIPGHYKSCKMCQHYLDENEQLRQPFPGEYRA